MRSRRVYLSFLPALKQLERRSLWGRLPTRRGFRMFLSIPKIVLSGCLSMATYSVCVTKSYADNWACEVLLCLSNPGGPTEFAECRPPIHRLWKHLAKGRSFPVCNGVGFRASRPGYEPHYCDAGYRLIQRTNDRGREVTCISLRPIPVRGQSCKSLSTCTVFQLKPPHLRERPRFVDVTIDGHMSQRVWF